MRVTYLFHSGFLAETDECYYMFDYWKGALPPLDPSKPIFVFASHSHADHYNPEIFALLRSLGMQRIFAVLARDIPRKRWPEASQPVAAEGLSTCPDLPQAQMQAYPPESNQMGNIPTGILPVVKAYHSQEYDLPFHTHVQTLLSTDSGVAYLVTCPEGVIYHAGDLNEWNLPETPEQERRQMTGSYRAAINKLKGKAIDIAFLPLDPRLKECYADGFLYFLKNVDIRQVFPMHYWEQPETIGRFLAEYPQYGEVVMDTERFRHS
ncbi:MAG: MBL fold metallo-hydrolase [Lachnospiraceae bacterium]|nr:MBL fold metallo-hydrolase [Lachnospiraceae bacterium]